MSDPINYAYFPMAETLALFQSITGTKFVEDDAPVGMQVAPSAISYVSLLSSELVGIDEKRISGDQTTAYRTSVSIRYITLSIRTESMSNGTQPRNVLEDLRKSWNTEANCVDLRSRNTSFVTASKITSYKNKIDNRAVYCAHMDMKFLWTSADTPFDEGSINSVEIEGTTGPAGTPAPSTVTIDTNAP